MKKPTRSVRPPANSPHTRATSSRAARRHAEAEQRRADRRSGKAGQNPLLGIYAGALRNAGVIGEWATLTAFDTKPQPTFALLLSDTKGAPVVTHCARCGEIKGDGIVLPFMVTVTGQVTLLPPAEANDPKGVRVALCHPCVDIILTPKPPQKGEETPTP